MSSALSKLNMVEFPVWREGDLVSVGKLVNKEDSSRGSVAVFIKLSLVLCPLLCVFEWLRAMYHDSAKRVEATIYGYIIAIV